MRLLYKVFLLGALFFAAFQTAAEACTSLIVSGKATRDGRPLILKNRDTGELNNVSMLVQGERWRYVGIVNAGDSVPAEVWGGHNEAGFAIMNTAAYNLNVKDQKQENEGVLMKRALEVCATLQDFENLLDTLPRPLCVDANFGVLDAKGGCAYYETGDKGYVKFDANDSRTAPEGYLLRTNYGISGDRSRDQGVERYYAIEELMKQLKAENRLDVQDLLSEVPRYLKHGLTHLNLYDFMPEDESQKTMFPFRDFIPRYITASCLLVQGVGQDELPQFTVSWTIVGYPLTTVAIPLVINPEGKIPVVVSPGKKGYAPLSAMGMELKKRLFCEERGNSHEYINLAQLANKRGTGILQQLKPVEKEICTRGNEVIDKMRRKGRFSKDLAGYYDWVDRYVRLEYRERFGLGD